MDLTLGTVQFGLSYGKRKNEQLIPKQKVSEILSKSVEVGIKNFDTAQAYGIAEELLGEARKTGNIPTDARVITKFMAPEVIPQGDFSELVRSQLHESQMKLQQDRLDVVLLHRFHDRWAHGERYWNALLEMRDAGFIGKLGVSVYQPEEAETALQDKNIGLIQLPFNLLDHRWRRPVFLNRHSRFQHQTELHCRSVYLQGALISDLQSWPYLQKHGFKYWQDRMDQLLQESDCQTRQELCFRYVLSQSWIDSMVIGVDSISQLLENFDLFSKGSLPAELVDKVNQVTSEVPLNFLNPGGWVEQ